jgi:hypothetical protein
VTRRRAYRAEVVRHAAATIGLPPEILEAIDDMAAIPTVASPLAQLKTMVVRPLVPAAIGAAGAIAAYRTLGRLPAPVRSWRGPLVALGAMIWREWPLLRAAADTDNYLLDRARSISSLLEAFDRGAAARGGLAVPAYVFGHTHRAEVYPLGEGDAAPLYLNSGTWTPILPAPFSLLALHDLFTFVEICHDPATGVMRPRLLVWNDAASRADLLRREAPPL